MKIGDIVICVDDRIKSNGDKPDLTFGKSYKIINIEREKKTDNYLMITVLDDIDRDFGYYDNRFMNISEYRKKKLNRLNKISNL